MAKKPKARYVYRYKDGTKRAGHFAKKSAWEKQAGKKNRTIIRQKIAVRKKKLSKLSKITKTSAREIIFESVASSTAKKSETKRELTKKQLQELIYAYEEEYFDLGYEADEEDEY